jgi:hypothetical protein
MADMALLVTGFDEILMGLDKIVTGSKGLDAPKDIQDGLADMTKDIPLMVADMRKSMEAYYKTTLDKVAKIGESEVDKAVDKLLG